MFKLLHSVVGNHLQIVELLLQEGADPNVQDSLNGFTALHICARMPGRIQLAKLLMSKGADIEQCDHDNLSPSYWAKECRNTQFLSIQGMRVCFSKKKYMIVFFYSFSTMKIFIYTLDSQILHIYIFNYLHGTTTLFFFSNYIFWTFLIIQIQGVPEPEVPDLDDLLAGLQEKQAERERILKPPKKEGKGKKGGKKKKK